MPPKREKSWQSEGSLLSIKAEPPPVLVTPSSGCCQRSWFKSKEHQVRQVHMAGRDPITKFLSPKYLTGEWRDFVFKEDDILALTYLKSGTYWMIEILSLIHTKRDPKWIQSVPIWERSPWIETNLLYEFLEGREGRLISSHLLIQLLPKSLFTSKAKIIHLIRDPRDVLVFGYFLSKTCPYFDPAASLQAHFEQFLQGNKIYDIISQYDYNFTPSH
ncbi:sulfotransferase 2A1-like [Erinaceus europaeus]|uniref:Sulfotransferase n=1 Tax=Erinaceus europaeus TaxID=9365 RepID=A0ABM3X0J1_ERIEU|nr:sulfotransferase 2A1-like [Erinaceus europaeus]